MTAINQDTLIIAAAIFLAIYVISFAAYLISKRYMGMRQIELKEQNARLDDYRAHLEKQLSELNLRFAASEGRWQELNHLVIAGQQRDKEPEQTSPLSQASAAFLRLHGIDANAAQIREDLIFMLTPFHDDLLDEFHAVVQLGRELDFAVVRGDEKAAQGDIFPHLLRLMVSARIVVANISGRNPNVFYELGIAHALNKRVILLAQSGTDVPFDIQSKRIVFYKNLDELKEKLTKMLTRTLAGKDA